MDYRIVTGALLSGCAMILTALLVTADCAFAALLACLIPPAISKYRFLESKGQDEPPDF